MTCIEGWMNGERAERHLEVVRKLKALTTVDDHGFSGFSHSS
jgi:hypothetical protein